MRTKGKILQHNRREHFFNKTLKSIKNYTNMFEGPI